MLLSGGTSCVRLCVKGLNWVINRSQISDLTPVFTSLTLQHYENTTVFKLLKKIISTKKTLKVASVMTSSFSFSSKIMMDLVAPYREMCYGIKTVPYRPLPKTPQNDYHHPSQQAGRIRSLWTQLHRLSGLSVFPVFLCQLVTSNRHTNDLHLLPVHQADARKRMHRKICSTATQPSRTNTHTHTCTPTPTPSH